VLSATLTALVVAVLALSPRLRAGESPTITIKNESSEPVLAKLRGPSPGVLSIPAGGSRTVNGSGGNYLAFFRYTSGGRYSYTKVGPFEIFETDSEVSEITIVLHTVDCPPSDPRREIPRKNRVTRGSSKATADACSFVSFVRFLLTAPLKDVGKQNSLASPGGNL